MHPSDFNWIQVSMNVPNPDYKSLYHSKHELKLSQLNLVHSFLLSSLSYLAILWFFMRETLTNKSASSSSFAPGSFMYLSKWFIICTKGKPIVLWVEYKHTHECLQEKWSAYWQLQKCYLQRVSATQSPFWGDGWLTLTRLVRPWCTSFGFLPLTISKSIIIRQSNS